MHTNPISTGILGRGGVLAVVVGLSCQAMSGCSAQTDGHDVASPDGTSARPQDGPIELACGILVGPEELPQVAVGAPHTARFRLLNCGDVELVVTGLRLDSAPDSPLALVAESFVANQVQTSWPQADGPTRIRPASMAEFDLVIDPQEAHFDDGPVAIPVHGSIRVEADRAVVDPLDVATMVFLAPCPAPTVDLVAPTGPGQALLAHVAVDGRESRPWQGAITSWQWSVSSTPRGVYEEVAVPDEPAQRVFEIHTAGRYDVCLTVGDDTGSSCRPACTPVIVEAPEGLYVEMIGRPFPEPTAGVPASPGAVEDDAPDAQDLDLHLVHEAHFLAATHRGPDRYPPDTGDGVTEPWFHPTADLWIVNDPLDWQAGDGDPRDARMLIDADLSSVEAAVFNSVDGATRYRIGVHHWESRWADASPVRAGVRVYLDGDLVADTQSCPLHPGDLWEAGAFDGASGQFIPLSCAAEPPAQSTPPDHWPERPCRSSSLDDTQTPCADVIYPRHEGGPVHPTD